MLRVADILRGVEGITLAWEVPTDTAFRSVTNDSRLAKRGSLFVAMRGERDGHDFIADAHVRGARGVIGERLLADLDWLPREQRQDFAYFVTENSLAALQDLAAYWRTRHAVDTIGVTGSVGKTTAKELIAHVLAGRFRVLKNEMNYNNEIGVPLTLLGLRRSHDVAVVEMGMYALGEIATLCRIARPRIGVVTNVGPTHLERLGSIERIAEAKSELVRSLPPDGAAILNGDDERVRRMGRLAAARVVTFGFGSECDVRAVDVVSRGLNGVECEIQWAGGRERVVSTLLGKHSVYACLAAFAVGLELRVPADEIVARLRQPPRQIRLSVVAGPRGSTIIDDTYNASPASTNAALEVLGEASGRRVAILGDMFELGDYEESGHREVGRQAAKCADVLVAVGERSRWTAEEARAAGMGDVREFAAREDVDFSPEPGDVILVKGSRGMRMDEIVARLLQSRDGITNKPEGKQGLH